MLKPGALFGEMTRQKNSQLVSTYTRPFPSAARHRTLQQEDLLLFRDADSPQRESCLSDMSLSNISVRSEVPQKRALTQRSRLVSYLQLGFAQAPLQQPPGGFARAPQRQPPQ